MIMADVLTWFLIVLGLYLTLVCHWLAAAALFPRAVEAFRERYARPVSATLLGLVLVVPLLVLGAAGAKVPNPLVAGLARALLVLLILPALAGSAGFALRVGAGLAAPSDGVQPWRRTLRGGVVLAGTFLLPFAGWFVVLPLTLVSGFGVAASVVNARRRRRRTTPSAATPAVEPTGGESTSTDGAAEGSTHPWKTV
jgi:hypothetical protein